LSSAAHFIHATVSGSGSCSIASRYRFGDFRT
jgi:hypothetical protein